MRQLLLRIPGLEESPSGFSQGSAFWVNGKEIAHFEGPEALDLRLTRHVISTRRAALRADPRVTLRRSGGDWIEVRFAGPADLPFVAELAELAAAAHRPAAGGPVKPPPTGPALERRRRFH